MESRDRLDYVMADDSHYELILDFMLEHFRQTEALGSAIGLSVQEAMQFFPQIIHTSLAQSGISLLVFDQNRELIAIRLTSIVDRPSNKVEKEEQGEASGGAGQILRLLHCLQEDVWGLVPGDVHRFAKFEIVSVRPDRTRRGIANRMINFDLDHLKNRLQCQALATESTSFNSQQLFVKNGYRILKEVKHEDWLDPEGGRVFSCKDGTDRAVLVFKYL